MSTITLDGHSLTRESLVAIARGARVEVASAQWDAVQKAADFIAEQVALQEPIYGVTTGFGSNANRLLGAHPVRADRDMAGLKLHEELQNNLIVTHAVCVGEPFASDVVRAMMAIRINTLLRGHSGIRVSTLQSLVDLLNADVVPVILNWARSVPAVIWHRCRTWRLCCSAAVKPSSMASE